VLPEHEHASQRVAHHEAGLLPELMMMASKPPDLAV
jgi:hypothetical protein